MNKRGRKKGSITLSFGMIFSIILVIAFLGVGFYAIKKFIGFQETIQVENFMRDFQQDVDKVWKSAQVSQVLTYPLPTKISSVCFTNDDFQNLRFTSTEIINGKLIEHLDIASIIAKENPYCITNTKGKVSITLLKEYGETLVRVRR
jgi:hypothetical protein